MSTTALVFACLIAVVSGSCRSVKVREDCGYPGISRSKCLENGCCFDDSIPDIKWCYYESAAASPCASWSCQSGGVCTIGNNQPNCTCPKAYSGEHCENYDQSKGDPSDPCKPTPCANGGNCTVGLDNKAVCQCPEGPYESPYCESIPVVTCQTNSCQNGGTCTMVDGAVKCKCKAGFTGPTCGLINPCDPSPCLDGGTCYIGDGNTYSCQCLPGYFNTRCQDVLMQKHDGLDFLGRTWAEMKAGLGDPTSSRFWLGNDKIHELTMTRSPGYKLRVDVQAKANGKWYYAVYGIVVVEDESRNYTLSIYLYSGNAGDSFFVYGDKNNGLSGMRFTTVDRDNDLDPGQNCAEKYGAFWQYRCTAACLNCKTGVGNGFSFLSLPAEAGTELIASRMTLIFKG